jgi:uncharacterized protein (DUF342 family)
VVDLAGIKNAVKTKLEEDMAIKVVETEGETLDDALAEACSLLELPIHRIGYEIVLKKTSFLGVGENLCKIRAYRNIIANKTVLEEDLQEDDYELEEVDTVVDKDGDVFLQRRYNGVFIKVTPATGTGVRASVSNAESVLTKYHIKDYDIQAVSQAVRAAAGEYVRVADYENVAVNDTIVNVDVSDQEMMAYITVMPPRNGGIDFTYENYLETLGYSKVTFGINESYLKDFADNPVYRHKVCVANGKQPVDGVDSYLEYYFETDMSSIRLKETNDGSIDFKELNLIQNVTKGERLAKKNDAEPGENGTTVTGKILSAKDGRDIAVTTGKNVIFADDGHTILADINGQVVLANGKISVEEVYVVSGNVNLKTGNIIFLGNVVIAGSVEEGFYVKASGNIEVSGTVDKASLTADGNIVVSHGITGKAGIAVRAGGNIVAKFIENAVASAGSMIMVSDSIVNSHATAARKILCQGRRATIVGGIVSAGELISAKTIGSPSGNTQTICAVGYDPETKDALDKSIESKNKLQAEFDDVQLNIQTLNTLKQEITTLPPDKEEYLFELTEKRKELSEKVKASIKEVKDLQEQLKNLTRVGRVTVSTKIYPGVVIHIQDREETVRKEFKSVTFNLEDNVVLVTKYSASDEKILNEIEQNKEKDF